MTDALTTKLGTTRAGPRTRIWLQGDRLPDHGFRTGTHFLKRFGKGRVTLTRCTPKDYANATRAERGKVSGDAVRPVIDITGEIVANTFADAFAYARFRQGVIVITDAIEETN